MRRHEIRLTVEAALSEFGFDGGLWAWNDKTASLEILIGETVRTIKLKSGTSRRALNYELGRLAGWADWCGRNKPGKPRAAYPGHTPTQAQIDIEEFLR